MCVCNFDVVPVREDLNSKIETRRVRRSCTEHVIGGGFISWFFVLDGRFFFLFRMNGGKVLCFGCDDVLNKRVFV